MTPPQPGPSADTASHLHTRLSMAFTVKSPQILIQAGPLKEKDWLPDAQTLAQSPASSRQ